MAENKYMVCVNCLTYNHSNSIEDAMNGFCQQETTFPFVCVIVDDNSNDGTQSIINSYLANNFELTDNPITKDEETSDYRLVFAQHKTNRNCFFVVYFLKYNHYQIKKTKMPYFLIWSEQSKYVAMCEGDDYWIDAQKLHIQVDFLESHLEHTMCIHAYRRDIISNEGIKSMVINKFPQDVEIIPDEIVLNGTGMFGATASIMYRAKAMNDYPEWAKRAPVGDKPIKLIMFARGHIGYINRVMCVYQVGMKDSWTDRMRFDKKYRKATQQRMSQMSLDFDRWTEGKYHNLIMKGEREYRIMCLINEMKLSLKAFLGWIRGFSH